VLLLSSLLALIGGFISSWSWVAGGLIGLIPAIGWLIDEFRAKTMGSDLLAVLALIGALTTDQLFAAAEVGDQLLIRSGEIVPTDGKLLKDATLDEAALTGEPLPVLRDIEGKKKQLFREVMARKALYSHRL
jgi:cation transport ATPase